MDMMQEGGHERRFPISGRTGAVPGRIVTRQVGEAKEYGRVPGG